MRLITLVPKGGQSCQEPWKATFHKWIHAADQETGRSHLGISPRNERVLQGHTQPLILQMGETEALGMEMIFACGTESSRES